jgi:hypothetical protein
VLHEQQRGTLRAVLAINVLMFLAVMFAAGLVLMLLRSAVRVISSAVIGLRRAG